MKTEIHSAPPTSSEPSKPAPITGVEAALYQFMDTALRRPDTEDPGDHDLELTLKVKKRDRRGDGRRLAVLGVLATVVGILVSYALHRGWL